MNGMMFSPGNYEQYVNALSSARAPSSNLEMKYTRGQDRDYSEVARYEIIGSCLSLRPCNAALKSREDLNFIGILNERERRLPLLTEALLMEEKLEKIGVEEAR